MCEGVFGDGWEVVVAVWREPFQIDGDVTDWVCMLCVKCFE